jgi:hypothetical protein
MQMVLKIVIFGAFFFGTVLLDRKVLLPSKILVPDLIFFGWLFCAYLALLYLEIRSRVRKVASQRQLRWAGFHFSFWAGLFWSIFWASPGSDTWFVHPVDFFSLLGGMVAAGVIAALFGMAITQFMVIFVFKQPEQT